MEHSPGDRLGPYEILSPLGAGGMGEVYRARDSRLGRDVAIKVLPASTASSPEARARFEREARALSQLHHPRVCSIFDVGEEAGAPYLVMELLEGETLASRLGRGALGARDLLKFAIQIAEGLDAAHRIGVVHRDLKPGNVMLTREGAKLLDFGLARVADAFSGGAPDASTPPTRSVDLTAEGAIVGTLRNMAPEQLEGGAIDGRTDLFAFGGMIHEMASGKPAFEAKSRASLVAAIMRETPPPLDALAPETPPALARVVTRCLEKDPDDRWQSTRDLLHQLRWIEESITSGSGTGVRGPSPAGTAASESSGTFPAAPARGRARRLPRGAGEFLAAALAVAVTLFITNRLHDRDPVATSASWRFEVPLPVEHGLPFGFAFSPDGQAFAFVSGPTTEAKLWIRSPDSIAPRSLDGTKGARFPFWSPDGRSIGFFAESKLKRIDLDGETVRVVCEAADGRGGTWNERGDILFAPSRDGVIHRVDARGGVSKAVTEADSSKTSRSHRWPWFLPDGKKFLFMVPGIPGQTDELRLAELGKSGSVKLLDGTSRAEFDCGGYLLYVHDKTLFAHRLDPRSGKLLGDPIPVEENVEKTGENGPTGYAAFASAASGELAFARPFSHRATNLVWVDRTGAPLDTIGTSASYSEPAISLDGNRLAVNIRRSEDELDDIWLVDLRREVFSRLTSDPSSDVAACWSPDGKWIAFSSEKRGRATVFRMPADGSRAEEVLVDSTSAGPGQLWSDHWSPDGKFLVIDYNGGAAGADKFDLRLLPTDGTFPAATIPFLETKFRETHACVSPDSRWVAYTSNESGSADIYVQSFPTPGSKWKISEHGGDQAWWRGDGRELYFLSFDRAIMAVDVTTGERFDAGVPRKLFTTRTADPDPDGPRAYYAPAADGQKFLVCMSGDDLDSAPLLIRTNWRRALEMDARPSP